jgi:hypothetical protein
MLNNVIRLFLVLRSSDFYVILFMLSIYIFFCNRTARIMGPSLLQEGWSVHANNTREPSNLGTVYKHRLRTVEDTKHSHRVFKTAALTTFTSANTLCTELSLAVGSYSQVSFCLRNEI